MKKLKERRIEHPVEGKGGDGRIRAFNVLRNSDAWVGSNGQTINLLTDDKQAIDAFKVSQLTAEQILGWPNAGKKTVAVIKEWLADFGLHLRKSPIDKNKILRCRSFLEKHGYQIITKTKHANNRRGRTVIPKWDKWTNAKINTLIQMREIDKMSFRKIGKQFNVSAQQVWRVYALEIRRRHWREHQSRKRSEERVPPCSAI